MNLREWRENRRFTLDEAAAYLTARGFKCTGSDLSKYERGERLPHKERLLKLCKLTRVAIGDLLTRPANPLKPRAEARA